MLTKRRRGLFVAGLLLVVACAWPWLKQCAQAVERSNSPHAVMLIPNPGVYPAKGSKTVDPATGFTIIRVADPSELVGDTDGHRSAMSLIVYSRYTPSNTTGEFVLVHGDNSTSAWVYRVADNAPVTLLRFNPALGQSSRALGELNELRWDYSGQHPYRLYFVGNSISGVAQSGENIGMSFYYTDLDPATGKQSTPVLVHDFSKDFPAFSKASIMNDVEGDSSTDSRFWAWQVMDTTRGAGALPFALFTFDMRSNTVTAALQRSSISQFLSESFIAVAFAMVIAAILVVLALPLFNHLSGKALVAGFLLRPSVIGTLGLLVIAITLLAGAYPAFFLSSIKPIVALRNKMTTGGKGKSIRSALVVFQFVISSGLILAIIIVDQQMSYIQNKQIGYDRDQLLVLRESYLLGSNEHVFRNQLMNDPRVVNISKSAFVPAGPTDNNMTNVYPGQQHEAVRRTIVYNIDENYIPTMGMQLTSGRNFQEGTQTDSLNVIINEASVKAFGLGDSPLGQTLTASFGNEKKSLTVIGVVRDFHFRSLHEEIVSHHAA